ncbi:MAG TPA: hypothetical protein VM142_13270 [Acidimicrobiales bacterium]|nr:hypothetical protein [Acidimicrobiales bacterium]
MRPPGQSALDVVDEGELVRISFDELVKYHGRGSIGGLAHGFKVMERGFSFLDGGNALERREVHVETAFDGPGSRDAFEMVTRAVTGGRYLADVNLAGAGRPAPEAPQGRFFFRLRYRGKAVDLTLREGHVSEEFIELVRRGPQSPEEHAYLARLKQDMADRLMPLAADEVYDARPS